MNLHEYQAKQLFIDFGIPTTQCFAAVTADEAVAAANKLGGDRWVVKAQVHAGGRGKAGGVAIVDSKDDIRAFANKLLGTNLVTFQTDANGQPVNTILVEGCTDIETELYLGAVIDRGSQRVVFMASTEGGTEIEKVAHDTPEKILKETINPLTGPQPFQGRNLAYQLGLQGDQVKQFTQLFLNMAKMFLECDLSLIEVNPLVITKSGDLLCLDGKINIDGNALYRQPKLKALEDLSQVDERENIAAEHELNYVALDGNIGCLVNGAGLAMGTMDIIKLHGGSPANFLDVGGGATKERVGEAFKLILSDDKVKAVLVNIFGGIVRCDLIADGVIGAIKEVGVKVPVVVRLEGNNAELGAKKLSDSGLNIIAAQSFDEAAKQVIKAAGVAA